MDEVGKRYETRGGREGGSMRVDNEYGKKGRDEVRWEGRMVEFRSDKKRAERKTEVWWWNIWILIIKILNEKW